MTDMPRVGVAASDVTRLTEAATQAMTDSMVERLTTSAANVMEVADKLGDQDVRDGLVRILEAVGEMQRSGALETVIETVFLIHAMRSAATDSMVERAFAFMEHMANNLGTEELATLAHETRGALEDALDECVKEPGGTGLMATIRMLNQKETQQALRFMLAFSCKLRQRTTVLAKTPPTP